MVMSEQEEIRLKIEPLEDDAFREVCQIWGRSPPQELEGDYPGTAKWKRDIFIPEVLQGRDCDAYVRLCHHLGVRTDEARGLELQHEQANAATRANWIAAGAVLISFVALWVAYLAYQNDSKEKGQGSIAPPLKPDTATSRP